jgi:hypothetical protein
MSKSEIVICQYNTDYEGSEPAIVLSEVIKSFDEKKCRELREKLVKIQPSYDIKLPIYTFVSDHIWTTKLSESSPKSREILVLLYDYLLEQITEETEKIRCYGVKDRYLNILQDLADNENIQLLTFDSKSNATTTRSLAAKSSVWILISVFDAFLSLLLKPFFSSSEANLLVKYPVFRSETFEPIRDNFDMEFDSTFTLLTISYFSEVKNNIDGDIEIIPIRCFSSISESIKSYKILGSFIKIFVSTDKIETAVIDSIEAETGIRLEKTVGKLTRRAIWTNLDSCLYYSIAQDLFNKEEYKSLLLTSFGPSGKPLAAAANEHDIDVYILPHGVCGSPTSLNESLYTGMFREGNIVAEEVNCHDKNLIPTGLPKHIKIFQQRGNIPEKNKNKTLLIATTGTSYRDAIIHDIVPQVLDKTDWKLIIKPHPSESKSYYSKEISDIGITIDGNERIHIVDDNLYKWIGRSHLLLTTRSNVAIESILLGTPAASYNPWSPDLWTPPYVKHGSVPSFKDPNEISSFLTELDYDAEQERQESMLDDLYWIRGNSIDDITARIQREIND